MPIRIELVHSVTLIAQPRSKHPLVKSGGLKSGRFETKKSGTFGLIWFTEFGEKFWEACQSIDDNAKLRLHSSGFDEMDWSVSFRFAGFKARITSKKYKGFFGKPGNSYMELRLGCPNPNDLRMFLQALATKFDTPPWIMNNWSKIEAATGSNKENVINAWSQAMGREITAEETETKGLGWISGKVSKIDNQNGKYKLPHIGWNQINIVKESKIFKEIENNSHMYFVHSYEFIPEDKNVISATTDYSSNIVCAVEKENIFGTQFHPEKSDKTGLKIIDNFINL